MQIQKIKNQKIKDFLNLYKKYKYFNEVIALLGWDTEVNMPVNSAERRGRIASILGLQAHELITSQEYENLLNKAQEEKDLNETEKMLIKRAKKSLEIQKKLPKKFVEEYSNHQAKASVIWRKAREEKNFSIFVEDLEKMFDLTRQFAQYKGYENSIYNALLDEYESDLDIETMDKIFSKLIPATKAIISKTKFKDQGSSILSNSEIYPVDAQMQICQMLVAKLGLDKKNGRLDLSTHPFTEGINLNDVRITTRCKPHDFLFSISGTMHEMGHALYEAGVNKELEDTPLSNLGLSLGLHESQSRTWENMVGKSREFCEFLLPILQSHFPNLIELSSQELYQIYNQVRPGFIRIEADELTYNSHIALRYEIEKRIFNKELKISDLPEFWNLKMKEHLDLKVDNPSNGVLQDIHWSIGNVGYFPTYTLGTVISAQLWSAFEKETPDYKSEFRLGNFSSLLVWLRENLHQYGMLYQPKELVKNITGEEVNVDYLIKYLEDKYKG